MSTIPDKSINLIVIDPPYNIGKADWDKIPDYVEWMGKVFKECRRVLCDSGSFYFFHNDFLQIVDLQKYISNNTDFVFKQFIVWNKRFDGARNKGFLDGFIEVENLRNYQQMAEYCLYYTLQSDTGRTTVMLDENNFPSMRRYFKELQEFMGLKLRQINATLGHRKAEHCFYWKSSQWDMPIPEVYQQLIDVFKINKWIGFREYESLRREYESLRREYEPLRYTYNNLKSHHSVWNYEIAPKVNHITPKPIDLVENIILHSSNVGDVVLDCFMGSGTTAIAALNTNRNYIGFELNKEYYEKSLERIQNHKIPTPKPL